MKPQDLVAVRGALDTLQNSERPVLQEYSEIILDHWRLLLALVAVGLVVGLFRAWVAAPTFTSDALIQVEVKSSALPGLETVSDSGMGWFLAPSTEIEILRSRKVLQDAVVRGELDRIARPHHFPLVGAAIVRGRRRTMETLLRTFIPGADDYAWIGETISVDLLEVSEAMRGWQLQVRDTGDGAYELFHDDAPLASGRVGELLTREWPDGRQLSLRVAELPGRAGAQFLLARQDIVGAAAGLRGGLIVAETAQGSRMLRLTFTGTDPALARLSLSAIAESYVAQNIERSSAEAQRKLEFVNARLPEVKIRLDESERKLREIRKASGAVSDLSEKALRLLSAYEEIEQELVKARLERDDLLERVTPEHPQAVAAAAALRRLETSRGQLDAQLRQLPEAEIRYVEYSRDAKVASELYVLLLNRAQELSLAKAGTIGNVRIIDSPVQPGKASGPNRKTIVGGSLLGFLLLGLLIIVVRRALIATLDNPDELEPKLGVPLYAVVPHSDQEAGAIKQGEKRTRARQLLARTHPGEPAAEALRSLRTSLQFALTDSGRKIVAVSGPTPGVGKSFVTANLAYLYAESGRRVLLVDGDLRRGHLHELLGLERGAGLSEICAGSASLADAVRPVPGAGNLHAITTGKLPPNPSELLMNERLAKALESLAQQYDLIILDTPPILAVTDALLLARHAGVILLALRHQQTRLNEAEESLRRLRAAGLAAHGLVFNGLRFRLTRYHYYQRYSYTYGARPAKTG